MDNCASVDRARAVLARLRDQLVEHRKLEPNPRAMVPADLAVLLNETLAELQPLYGEAWVTSASVSRWAIVPSSSRNGARSSFPTIQRDVLLGYVKGALRRLNADAPPVDAPLVVPSIIVTAQGAAGMTQDAPTASTS